MEIILKNYHHPPFLKFREKKKAVYPWKKNGVFGSLFLMEKRNFYSFINGLVNIIFPNRLCKTGRNYKCLKTHALLTLLHAQQ